MSKRDFQAVAVVVALSLSACTAPPTASTATAPESAPPPVAEQRKPLPAGTILRVRLYNAIDTSHTRNGDSFIASLSAPITVDEKTVLPKGTVVRGTVRHAASSGRLKGRASVTLTLDRMEWNGAEVSIDTNSVTLTSADHKKRNLAWIGGSSAAGALIGGLLGGGKGALLGAGAGGGAGVATAAATGKRQVRIPAESLLTFRLTQPVEI
jgi:outer membrane lipoprotein SlyB